MMPAIVAEMKESGYWAQLHVCSQPEIIEFTMKGLQSTFEHHSKKNQGGPKWATVSQEQRERVVEYFGQADPGTQYVLGMSFVGPSGLSMLAGDTLHRISFHDAAHMKNNRCKH